MDLDEKLALIFEHRGKRSGFGNELVEDYFSGYRLNTDKKKVSLESEFDCDPCYFVAAQSFIDYLKPELRSELSSASSFDDLARVYRKQDTEIKEIVKRKRKTERKLRKRKEDLERQKRLKKTIKLEKQKLRKFAVDIHNELSEDLNPGRIRSLLNYKNQINRLYKEGEDYVDTNSDIEGLVREIDMKISDKKSEIFSYVDTQRNYVEGHEWLSKRKVKKLDNIREDVRKKIPMLEAIGDYSATSYCHDFISLANSYIEDYHGRDGLKTMKKGLRKSYRKYLWLAESVEHRGLSEEKSRDVRKMVDRLKMYKEYRVDGVIDQSIVENYNNYVKKKVGNIYTFLEHRKSVAIKKKDHYTDKLDGFVIFKEYYNNKKRQYVKENGYWNKIDLKKLDYSYESRSDRLRRVIHEAETGRS